MRALWTAQQSAPLIRIKEALKILESKDVLMGLLQEKLSC
jgi:hypothetical protein